MGYIKSNKAIKLGIGLYNSTVGKVTKKGFKHDWFSNIAYPQSLDFGPTQTKKIFRGASAEEAELYKQGKFPGKGNLTYWSNTPETAKHFANRAGDGGHIIEAEVALNPSKRETYFANHLMSDEGFSRLSARYPNGYGYREGGGREIGNEDDWLLMHPKYLKKNASNIKVSKA
jgi:hypothetical protein